MNLVTKTSTFKLYMTSVLFSYTFGPNFNQHVLLGNELCGTGVAARIEAEQYAKDTIALKKLVKELHPDPKTQPKVISPGGFYEEKWFNTFLKATGQDVVDGTSHHIYNLGPGIYP